MNNDLVTIRNKKTGETRQVPRSQLPNYGVNAPASPTTPDMGSANNDPFGGVKSFLGTKTLPNIAALLGGLVGPPGAAAGYAGVDAARKMAGGLLGVPREVNRVTSISPYDLLNTLSDPLGLGNGPLSLGRQPLGDTFRKQGIQLPDLQIPESGQANISDLADTVQGARSAFNSQLMGNILAHGAGALFNPIKTITSNFVVNPLKESGAMININNLLGDLLNKGESYFGSRLASNEFMPAFNTFTSNVRNALPAIHEGAQNILNSEGGVLPAPIGDITQAAGNIPAFEANLLKTNLQHEVPGRFWGNAPPITAETAPFELRKLFSSLLKGNIEQAVPEVALPNKIASGLHSVQNNLGDALTLPFYLLGGFRAGRIASKIGDAPLKLLQHLVPPGGGALNQLLPALFQFGGNQ